MILSPSETQIYLADTMGEVPTMIVDALFCIIGGSFIPHGGQNFMEAAALEKAILCGPHMHNFEDVYHNYKEQEAIKTSSVEALSNTLKTLIEDVGYRNKLAQQAYKQYSQEQKVIEHYLKLISD